MTLSYPIFRTGGPIGQHLIPRIGDDRQGLSGVAASSPARDRGIMKVVGLVRLGIFYNTTLEMYVSRQHPPLVPPALNHPSTSYLIAHSMTLSHSWSLHPQTRVIRFYAPRDHDKISLSFRFATSPRLVQEQSFHTLRTAQLPCVYQNTWPCNR